MSATVPGDIEISEERISRNIGFSSILMRHLDRINKLASEISNSGASYAFWFSVKMLQENLRPYLMENEEYKKELAQVETKYEKMMREGDPKQKNEMLCMAAAEKFGLVIVALKNIDLLLESVTSDFIDYEPEDEEEIVADEPKPDKPEG